MLIEAGLRNQIKDPSAIWKFSSSTNHTELVEFIFPLSMESKLSTFAHSALYSTYDGYNRIIVAKDRNVVSEPKDIRSTLRSSYTKNNDKGLGLFGYLILDERGDLCLITTDYQLHFRELSIDPMKLLNRGSKRGYRVDVESVDGVDCISLGTVKIRGANAAVPDANPEHPEVFNPFDVLEKLGESDMLGVKAFFDLVSETTPFSLNPKSQRVNGVDFTLSTLLLGGA
jgi:hypothetical protein